MPGNYNFDQVKIKPKLEKSTDLDHKPISSEGSHAISACKILGYSLHAFPRKCPETPNFMTSANVDKWLTEPLGSTFDEI